MSYLRWSRRSRWAALPFVAAVFAVGSGCGESSASAPGSDPSTSSGAGDGSTAQGAITPGSGGAGGLPSPGGGEDLPDLMRTPASESGRGGGSGAAASGPVTTPPLRSVTALAEGWRFLRADAAGAEAAAFDDGAWQAVSVPHTYNALDGQDGGSSYYQGPAWYRLHVSVPAAGAGRRTYLEFDAASSVADVYVNGARLGQHRGAFSRFRFDATSALVPGDNLLAVRVDNSLAPDIPPLSADFTFFGGLYREARLITLPALHVDMDDSGSSGVYLRASDVTAASATLNARVRVTNAAATDASADVGVDVLDASGQAVARLTASAVVAAGQTVELPLTALLGSPHLWDGKVDPYLYTAAVQVSSGGALVDSVTQPFGVRAIALDANTGFSLNGHYLDLHGVNRHQDRQDRGWAIGNAEHDEDMALILELGATAVRLAHYQHSQYFYDLCDRAGLIVWAEIPLVNAITNSAAFTANARQQLTELIAQSYDHPSIAFFSIGNEQRTDDAPTNALLAELATEVQTQDPSRLSVYAHCCGPDTSGLTQHTDAIGYNYYYGWYMGTYDQVGPWADAAHAASPSARIAMSEYGAGAALSQHQEPPAQPQAASLFHPEEYQSALHESYWQQLSARPFIWGKFIWNMFDFAVDSRNEGDTPGRNDKGLVSYDRKTRKDAFYWYKANWSSEPFVHINSRRDNPRTTPSIDVRVYSNLAAVSLSVNGRALPPPVRAADHIFVWNGVALQTGTNQVEAHATGPGSDATDNVAWQLQ